MCTEFNVQMTKPMPKQTVLQAQSALASAVSLNQMVSDRGTRLLIHSVGIPPLVFSLAVAHRALAAPLVVELFTVTGC